MEDVSPAKNKNLLLLTLISGKVPSKVSELINSSSCNEINSNVTINL